MLSAVFELIDEISLILFELGFSLRFLLFEVGFLVGNLFFGYADNFLQKRFRSAAFVVGGVSLGKQAYFVLDAKESAIGKKEVLASLGFAIGSARDLPWKDIVTVERFVEAACRIGVFTLLVFEFFGIVVAYKLAGVL